jgi:deoxycytidine triphosphate deaminase
VQKGGDIEEINRSGGMLSVVDLREKIVPNDEVDKYRELFEKREWDEIIKQFGDHYLKKFAIQDYNELNFTPFSYDLSIGHELFSIQSSEPRVIPITEEQPYRLEPSETVVVITREWIAIPYYYSATVWPRFNMVRSGIIQSMVKIDPTWYGKLAVAMSNLSPATLEIKRDTPFGTLLLYELKKPSDVDLWKEEDLEIVDVKLPDTLKHISRRLEKFIYEDIKLRGYCWMKDDYLQIRGIKRDQLEALIAFDQTRSWNEFIKNISKTWVDAIHPKTGRRMIGMEALGMMNLEPILKGVKRGSRTERESIEIGECRQVDLISAAVRYGKPFDLIANIPKMVSQNFERDTIPRIQAQVEANLFPKTVTLTLTVLGFLSFIIAVSAFVIDRYRPSVPAFIKIDWPITLIVLIITIALVLMFSFRNLMSSRLPALSENRLMEKKLKNLEKKIQSLEQKIR